MNEVVFYLNDTAIKRIKLETIRDKTTIEVLELGENGHPTLTWKVTHFKIHNKYNDARLEYMGLVNSSCYENGN